MIPARSNGGLNLPLSRPLAKKLFSSEGEAAKTSPSGMVETELWEGRVWAELHGVSIGAEGRGVLHDDRKRVLGKVNEPRRIQSSK